MLYRGLAAIATFSLLAPLTLLPANAEPVEYVRVCPDQPGSAVVPGSEGECVKLGGADDTIAIEGAAMAMAMPGVVIEPGHTFGLGINVGTYGGATALGLSAGVKPMEGFTLNGAIGVGNAGKVGARAGANFSW